MVERAAPSAATPTCRRRSDTDAGARFLGELGIGTNFGIDRPIGAILFDEKIGGTIHLALGRSYPETGGTNESVVHWDLIWDLRDGGTLTADGEATLRRRDFHHTLTGDALPCGSRRWESSPRGLGLPRRGSHT